MVATEHILLINSLILNGNANLVERNLKGEPARAHTVLRVLSTSLVVFGLFSSSFLSREENTCFHRIGLIDQKEQITHVAKLVRHRYFDGVNIYIYIYINNKWPNKTEKNENSRYFRFPPIQNLPKNRHSQEETSHSTDKT